MKRILQIMAVLFAFTASAAVVEVHNVSELTNAVKNAADGSTIRLMKSGSPYVLGDASMAMGMGGYQSKTPYLLVVNKNLTIEGEDSSPRTTWTDHAEPVIVDGNSVGGFVHGVSGKKVIIRHIAFTGGTCFSNYTAPIYSAKSAIADPNSDIVCTNCIFRQNSGSNYSGAFCAAVYDSLVTNNSVCAMRACYLEGCDIVGSTVVPTSLSSAYGCTFRAIESASVGSEIATMSNCTIVANSFPKFMANSGTFIDCRIMTNNITSSSYTSDTLVHSGMTVRGCLFEGNFSDALHVILPASYSCTNCIFRNNSCRTVARNPAKLVSCTFEGNVSGWNGGAVCIQYSNLACWIEGCTFKRNSTGQHLSGGAIYMARRSEYQCSAIVTNCTFEGNFTPFVSSCFGGAIVNADAWEFLNANARNDYLPAGENAWDSFLVVDCTFKTNVACHAAGVYGVRAVNCKFDGNVRYNRDAGYHYGNAALRSFLQDCDSNDGEFYGCVLDRCHVHDVDYTSMTLFKDFTRVTNCLVEKCFARSNGSLYGYGHVNADGRFDAEFVNCTFVENRVNTYAAYATVPHTNGLLLANCLFNGNSNGYYKTDFDVYKNSSDYTNGFDHVTFQNVCVGKLDVRCVDKADFIAKTNAPNAMIFCTDPKFVGRDPREAARYPSEPYWALSLKSPLLGMGGVADWMANATDLEGRKRLGDDGSVDIGCYQCWLVPPGMMLIVH